MATTVWDPAQYLRFGSERLRPALDLLARIPLSHPAHVVDLGCGAGNVTAILRERWPEAEILGVDGSGAMLARARETAPGCRFVAADIAGFVPERQPEIIFSNAALHWLGDHPLLFPRLISLLAPGGVLAVQMPAMDQAPFRTLQQEVARSGSWAGALSGIGRVRPILDRTEYWDLLRPLAHSVDIWETTYLHVLTGPDAVLQWAMGTSLRPYLAALEEPARSAFREAYRLALRPHYPERENGTTFLPFRRLFMLAVVATAKSADPPSEAERAGTAAPIPL